MYNFILGGSLSLIPLGLISPTCTGWLLNTSIDLLSAYPKILPSPTA
ncbi:hypothetical protein [Chryseobacterium indoltheticum]